MNENNHQLESESLEGPLTEAVQALLAEPLPEDAVERVKLRARRLATIDGPRSVGTGPMPNRTGTQSGQGGGRRMFGRMPVRVALAAVIAGMCYLGFVATPSGNAGFAQVAEKIRTARTFTFDVTIESGGDNQPMRWKTLCLGTNRTREELPGGVIQIADRSSGTTLSLHADQKLAIVTQVKKTGPAAANAPEGLPIQGMVEQFKSLADKRGEPFGEKEFSGVKLRGFRVGDGPEKSVVWADVKTGEPARVEMVIRLQGKTSTVVFDHFVLDARLDESLFSVEPPAGYKLQKQELTDDGSVPSENDMIALLQGYAERSEGRFPKLLDDWGDFAVLFSKNGSLDDKSQKVMQSAGRVMIFLQMHNKEGDWGYAPQDVKLGDAKKIVFWYRDEKSKKFRAIYGDLKVAEVEADQLPKTEKK